MKTPEQIREWLQSQEWYKLFRLNTYLDNISLITIEKVLSGNCRKNTIVLSFVWESTKEGWDFWNKVNDDFEEWYNKEEKK